MCSNIPFAASKCSCGIALLAGEQNSHFHALTGAEQMQPLSLLPQPLDLCTAQKTLQLGAFRCDSGGCC